MSKAKSVIKKTLKAIVWVALGFVFLFLMLALLIQAPTIQNKLVQYATTLISNKTHTKVELKSIHISFPKSVVIDGLFLEDRQRDTLLYSGNTKVNIALYDLFKSKITINSVALEDATIKLHSTLTNPIFNYNFLLSAFSDTTALAKTDTLSASKWSFSIDAVSLKNIRFTYNDEYSGMYVFASLRKSDFGVDELNPKKSVYRFNDLFLDGLTARVGMKKTGNTASNVPGNILPEITTNKLQLNNSTINYIDSVGFLSVSTAIDRCELENASIDIQKELIGSDKLNLSKSKIQYRTFEPEWLPNSSTKNNWKINLKYINLRDNILVYNVGDKAEMKGVFNPDYWEFSRLTLNATDFHYSADLIKIRIDEFSATDQNNFAITRLETDFAMDDRSISAKKLKAAASNSSIDADFSIEYSSMAALADSMKFRQLNIALRNLQFRNSDLLYFKPNLAKQSFFRKSQNITAASGEITGNQNNLVAKNLAVKTGVNTVLETDFNIKGISEFKTATYDFPNLRLVSGREDLEMMASAYIPASIALPKNIRLQLAFKGRMKSFETNVSLTSSFGDATLIASIDPEENFSSKITLSSLNLGLFLKDTLLYGPLTLTAEAIGQGLNLNTIRAKIKADASQVYLEKYNYHNLKLDGTVSGKQFEGKLNLNDENAMVDFDGLVNLNSDQEQYKFKLNVLGADLQKLRLTKNDLRISFVAATDLKGGKADQMNGTAGITNIVVASQGKKYVLDSFLSATVNEPKKSKLDISSALIDIKYSGSISPTELPKELSRFVHKYFAMADSSMQPSTGEPSDFSFEIQLHNHPILSQVILPQLKEFEPGIISGSFDGLKNKLKLNATMKKIVYASTEIDNLVVDVNSDQSALNYSISSSAVSNSKIKFDHLTLDGKLANNTLLANVSSISDNKVKKLEIRSQVSISKGNYKLAIDPKDFYLMNKRWDIAADNYIEFGKQGFLIHHFFLNNTVSQINIASVNNRFNDDINLEIKNFRLDDISRIIEKDTSLITGNVDGNLLLKRVNNAYGLIADAQISKLSVHEIPIGEIILKAENQTANRFNLEASLSGNDNNLTVKGFYVPNGGDQSISMEMAIQSLSMRTVEAFSMGQISEASGMLTGNLHISGAANSPEISGDLVFDNAFLKPAMLNNKLGLKHETIQLKNDGIYFNSFTITDSKNNTAVVDGSVGMKQMSDFSFKLQVSSKDFLLFNTTAKDNKDFYGRMVIDSKISVSGPMALPVIDGKVKMKKGSNFTFAVPEDKLTTDNGEGVIEFEDTLKLNPILYRNQQKNAQKSSVTGIDLSSIIEIDKQATLRLLIDPASTDSLVVKGEAALSFAMDRSGKMSLTGAYNLDEGSYLVSLESVVKRKFDILPGSTIIWNGDPLEAEISINASYSVRAAPYDLVTVQMDQMSDTEKSTYKQRYPFLVMLKLRGEILHPEISFEIQLPPQEKGILGGSVNQKLSLLNEDPSALNKQVFALLVLGRFVQENPLQTESGGTSTLIRSTVGNFLSAQLNKLSSKFVPGVELNFDIQSYDDYTTGQAQGRTQVGIGIKKQLFKERLSVQVGGNVDVEGEKAKQNSASDITSDVTIEYKLTEDGRYRLKGFRHNQYEGAIEGQLVETGAGVSFVHDFNRWKYFFKSPKRTRNDTIRSK